jgi:transcriptional regulator with XRE-family HTH domain
VAESFDLPGAVRRIRRQADMSQRQLAEASGLSVSAVAHAEAGTRGLAVGAVARAAAVAGLRLVLLDEDGREVVGMASDAARDFGGRLFPAHLDTMYSEERMGRWEHRPRHRMPWYTFDRDRAARDAGRAVTGTPEDHQLPQSGDSPDERRRERQREARPRWQAEMQRRREAGEVSEPLDVTCSCPPECEQLDQGLRPVHAPNCGCGCDID